MAIFCGGFDLLKGSTSNVFEWLLQMEKVQRKFPQKDNNDETG